MNILVFYVTHPTEQAAKDLAAHLLEKRLIACANIFPIQSTYCWDGSTQNENEWVSMLKTTLRLEPAVEAEISAVHPDELPCIMRNEARANADYVRWISDQCTNGVAS